MAIARVLEALVRTIRPRAQEIRSPKLEGKDQAPCPEPKWSRPAAVPESSPPWRADRMQRHRGAAAVSRLSCGSHANLSARSAPA